jgi:hypothetical protein
MFRRGFFVALARGLVADVLFLVAGNLAAQAFGGGIGSGFERGGIFLAEQRATGYQELYFDGFVIDAVFIVEAENNFATGYFIVKSLELIKALLNKIKQFLIGVEVHRMHLYFHKAGD